MLKQILTYLLSVWYLALFQIYPVVHVHWHGDAVETCFIAVEYNRADHVVHSNLHAAQDQSGRPHNFHAHDNVQCPDMGHFGSTSDETSSDCHHLHVNADYAHFTFDSSNTKKTKNVDASAALINAIVHNDPPIGYFSGSSIVYFNPTITTPSNKSPPLC